MYKYFKLPAQRVAFLSDGKVTTDYIFEVAKIETNMIGGRGFDAFLDIVNPWAWTGAKVKTVCVAVGRGEFVSEAEFQAQQKAESPAPQEADKSQLLDSVEFEMAVFNSDDDRVYNVNGTKNFYATKAEMERDAQQLREAGYYVEMFQNGEFLSAWIPED